MEKEDRMIKTLLNEGFMEKAPEGFTDRVMQSIEAMELAPQEQLKSNNWIYGFVITASIPLTFAIISIIDNSFVSRYYFLFSGYIKGFFLQLTAMFNQSSLFNSSLSSGSGLLIGISSIMVLLLVFDGIVLQKKRHVNLFAWSF